MPWVPEACTLPTEEQPLRVAEFDALFAAATGPPERLAPTRLRLHLPAGQDNAARARDLIARETGCCSLFSFDLRPSVTDMELDVEVPEAHTAVLDAMQQRVHELRTGGRS